MPAVTAPGSSGDPADLDPRVVFAAERTLLAWVRTSLAMAGLGFVLARFGLLGQEPENVPQVAGLDVSEAGGILLIAMGVVVNVLASVGHVRFMRRYRRGVVSLPGPLSMAVVIAILVGLLGAALAWYLVHIA